MNITACTWKIMLPDTHDMGCPRIHRVGQIEGPDKFAVRLHGRCLDINSQWTFEPMPSNRDDAFMKRCRFDGFEDAVKAYENIL